MHYSPDYAMKLSHQYMGFGQGSRPVLLIYGLRVGTMVEGFNSNKFKKEEIMPDSTYKIIELVGTSEKSFEEAAKNAVKAAAKNLKDLRIAEITQLDVKIENGKVTAFRCRVKLSFKYHGVD